jgi:hypothetical protein
MNNLINPKDFLTPANYAKKYKVCKRKIYRYIKSNTIVYLDMDGIAFLRDTQFDHLLVENVKILTKEGNNSVKILTNDSEHVHNSSDNTENQEVNDVKILTNNDRKNVKILTITNEEQKLLDMDDSLKSIEDFEREAEIRKKYGI